MSRPLRVDVEGGWYHITARGIERRAIFVDEAEHRHFVELVEEMSSRYGVEVHAYALMGNHYHLLIRTPKANASAAVQWLNVSYSAWFNRRRERVGPVFQGRFGSTLIDGEGAWAVSASVYIHLNPVRTKGYGLEKATDRAEGRGLVVPSREELKRRLKGLRESRWSSFRAYAGYGPTPPWLRTDELLRRAGGRAAYRRYVQEHVTRGSLPEAYEGAGGRLALGTREFQERVKQWVGRVTKEHTGRRQLDRTVSVGRIVAVVERWRGERWSEFRDRHGDWGRDLVLYLARKRSGLTLREIGAAAGGMEYKAVGRAVQRFGAALASDRAKRRAVADCDTHLTIVET
jgi:putative transposase